MDTKKRDARWRLDAGQDGGGTGSVAIKRGGGIGRRATMGGHTKYERPPQEEGTKVLEEKKSKKKSKKKSGEGQSGGKRKKKKGSKKNKKKDKTIQDLLNEQGYDPRQEQKMLQDRLRQRERNRNIRDRVKRSRQMQTRRNNRRDMYNTMAGTGREGLRRRQLGETQGPGDDAMAPQQANRGGRDEPGRNFARIAALKMAGDESIRPRTPSQYGRHDREDPAIEREGLSLQNTDVSMFRDSHSHIQRPGWLEIITKTLLNYLTGFLTIPYGAAKIIITSVFHHMNREIDREREARERRTREEQLAREGQPIARDL